MMTDTKFTPGPWRVGRSTITRVYCSKGDRIISPRDLIGQVEGRYCGQDVANANLIAAAPEMYDVLEQIQEWMLHIDMDFGVTNDYLYSDIKCLLKKARGEE